MRLIDSDALKASIVRQCDVCRKLGLDEIAEAIQKGFLQEIDNAPTIEPERKKGKWIEDDEGYFYCDQCGKYPAYQITQSDYCPNCGSAMKEGDHE